MKLLPIQSLWEKDPGLKSCNESWVNDGYQLDCQDKGALSLRAKTVRNNYRLSMPTAANIELSADISEYPCNGPAYSHAEMLGRPGLQCSTCCYQKPKAELRGNCLPEADTRCDRNEDGEAHHKDTGWPVRVKLYQLTIYIAYGSPQGRLSVDTL